MKIGLEIEFIYNDDISTLMKELDISSYTTRDKKELKFNPKGIGLTKEYYSNMRECNIAFRKDIGKLGIKIKGIIHTLSNLGCILYNTEDMNYTGVHIVILPEEGEDINKFKWSALARLSELYKVSSRNCSLGGYDTERLCKSHHIMAYAQNRNKTLYNAYREWGKKYSYSFKSDKPVYSPVTIKKKNIGGKDVKILELRAVPTRMFINNPDKLLKSLIQYIKVPVSEKRAKLLWTEAYSYCVRYKDKSINNITLNKIKKRFNSFINSKKGKYLYTEL